MTALTPEVIRTLRRALGSSREAFAERLGVSVNAVRDWEQGRQRPRLSQRQALEMALQDFDATRDIEPEHQPSGLTEPSLCHGKTLRSCTATTPMPMPTSATRPAPLSRAYVRAWWGGRTMQTGM
jgi:transcriptional regulator with XRE-family HTH domain